MTSTSSTFDDTGSLGFTRNFTGGAQGVIAPIEPLPTLTVGLVQDTGASASDRITSNDTLTGKVGTTVGATLQAAVDDGVGPRDPGARRQLHLRPQPAGRRHRST